MNAHGLRTRNLRSFSLSLSLQDSKKKSMNTLITRNDGIEYRKSCRNGKEVVNLRRRYFNSQILLSLHATFTLAVMASSFLFFFFFFFYFFFVTFSSSFYGDFSPFELEEEEQLWLDSKDDEVNMVQSRRASQNGCDFSAGKWVFDQSYPLYDSSCPYLSTAVTCRKNGRPDSDYEKWKWKAQGCSIPRYVY